MSTNALFRIALIIRKQLEAALTKAPDPSPEIVIDAPGSLTPPPGERVHWWLYQVTEDECSRNAQPITTRNGRKALVTQTPPLTLNMHFLLTPYCKSFESDLMLLGKAMGWLYDNSVHLIQAGDELNDTVRISIETTEIEYLSRIWESLHQNYRLSVGYLVRVARIQSTQKQSHTPVLSREGRFTEPQEVEP